MREARGRQTGRQTGRERKGREGEGEERIIGKREGVERCWREVWA